MRGYLQGYPHLGWNGWNRTTILSLTGMRSTFELHSMEPSARIGLAFDVYRTSVEPLNYKGWRYIRESDPFCSRDRGVSYHLTHTPLWKVRESDPPRIFAKDSRQPWNMTTLSGNGCCRFIAILRIANHQFQFTESDCILFVMSEPCCLYTKQDWSE